MPQVVSRKGQVVEPPPLPGPVSDLLACAADQSLCRRGLGAVLQQDPLLARRFLRFAQSPITNDVSPMPSMGVTVSALDTEQLRHLSLAAAIVHLLPAGRGAASFDRYQFWEHSVATGVFARMLVAVSNKPLAISPSMAFSAGLLHDLGRLILAVYFPREFSAVVHYQQRHDTWIRDAEAAVLGYDHCLVGANAARAWGLPGDLVTAIAGHHQPDRHADDQAAALVGVVHVADILARGMQIGYPGDDTIPLLSEQTLRRLGLNWQSLRQCLDQAMPLMELARKLVRVAMQPD